jgi:hypothetical protein
MCHHHLEEPILASCQENLQRDPDGEIEFGLTSIHSLLSKAAVQAAQLVQCLARSHIAM